MVSEDIISLCTSKFNKTIMLIFVSQPLLLDITRIWGNAPSLWLFLGAWGALAARTFNPLQLQQLMPFAIFHSEQLVARQLCFSEKKNEIWRVVLKFICHHLWMLTVKQPFYELLHVQNMPKPRPTAVNHCSTQLAILNQKEVSFYFLIQYSAIFLFVVYLYFTLSISIYILNFP